MKSEHIISPIDQYVIVRVRQFRMEKNIGSTELATMLDVTRSYIINVESGAHPAKYNLRHLNSLAWYCNVSPGIFLPGEPFEP